MGVTMGRKTLARMAAGLLAVAGTVAMTGTPANAASVAGNCTVNGYAGWGVAYYTVSGNLTYWEYFALEQLRAGNQTTAFVRVLTARAGADLLHFGPAQVHNLAHDTPRTYDPVARPATQNSFATYASFQFRFDEDNSGDPECYANTPTV
jgi:hypothetical protein